MSLISQIAQMDGVEKVLAKILASAHEGSSCYLNASEAKHAAFLLYLLADDALSRVKAMFEESQQALLHVDKKVIEEIRDAFKKVRN